MMFYLKLHFQKLAAPFLEILLDGRCLLLLRTVRDGKFISEAIRTSSGVRVRDVLHLS
jgi:hypothetical protein